MAYKIPYRQCYADTLTSWMRWTLWCHLVLRVFPDASSPTV
jgi:hypothetical protein